MYCPDCGAEVPYGARFCPTCGCPIGDQAQPPAPGGPGGYGPQSYQTKVYVNKKSAGLALLLSLIIPGLGEIYVGESGKGAAILVANILCGILGLFFFFPLIISLALWIYSMYDSYVLAKQHNEYLLSHDGNPPPKGRRHRGRFRRPAALPPGRPAEHQAIGRRAGGVLHPAIIAPRGREDVSCHSARPSIVIDRLRKRSSPWRCPLCARGN